MTKTRYTLSILVGFFLLAFVCSPPLLGLLIKHETMQTITRLNQSYPNLKISLNNFHQGWFQSRFEVTCYPFLIQAVTFPPPQINGNNNIHAYITVSHGPLIFLAPTVGTALPKLQPGIAFFRINSPNLHLKGRILWHLTNLLSTDFVSPSMSASFSGNRLEIKGLHNQTNLDPNHHEIKFFLTLKIASFKFKSSGHNQPFSFATKNLKMSSNLQKINKINYGQQQVSAEQIAIDLPQHQFQLHGVTYNSNINLQKKVVNITSQSQADRLSGKTAGITRFHLAFSITELDATYFTQLMFALTHNTTHWQLTSAIMNLIRKGFHFKLHKLFITTSEGPTTLSAQLQVPPLPEGAPFIDIASAISFDFKLKIPKTEFKDRFISLLLFDKEKLNFFKQNPSSTPDLTASKMIALWEKEQRLIPIDNHYKIEVKYSPGNLLINGREINGRERNNSQRLD